MEAHKHHYAEYYGTAQLARWRELGARDKAANIMALWRAVGQVQPPKVIDIGCGDGAVIWELGRRGFGDNYVGYEISDSGIRYANSQTYAKSTRFELFNGESLPADDNSFDLAILSHVIEHVESPRPLLKEAARVAKFVFVEVPLELTVRTPHDFHWTNVGHINLYNPLLIRHLVQSVGLTVLSERVTCQSLPVFTFQRPGIRGAMTWMVKAISLKVAPWLARRLWTYHGALIAQERA